MKHWKTLPPLTIDPPKAKEGILSAILTAAVWCVAFSPVVVLIVWLAHLILNV